MSISSALSYPDCYYSDKINCYQRFPDIDEDIFVNICCESCKTYHATHYLRSMIKNILIDHGDQFLERILPNITVIAVGCGHGATEQALFGCRYPIIGVDPEANSYNDKGPQFVTIVSSYLSELSLPKSPKLLSIIWPGPVHLEYDIEALVFTEWDQILLFYDKNGDIEDNSGSQKFHTFLSTQTTYELIFSVVINIGDTNLFTLELYQHKNLLPLPELYYNESTS